VDRVAAIAEVNGERFHVVDVMPASAKQHIG
jgi:hypothetical protein